MRNLFKFKLMLLFGEFVWDDVMRWEYYICVDLCFGIFLLYLIDRLFKYVVVLRVVVWLMVLKYLKGGRFSVDDLFILFLLYFCVFCCRIWCNVWFFLSFDGELDCWKFLSVCGKLGWVVGSECK